MTTALDITAVAYPAPATGARARAGVMRNAVLRFFSRRSTRKRKPWKVKVCPGSGIDCASWMTKSPTDRRSARTNCSHRPEPHLRCLAIIVNSHDHSADVAFWQIVLQNSSLRCEGAIIESS
jgi:hypothetical protein